MSKQYGNSSKSTGAPAVNKHPGSDPKGASEDPFSAMATVDAKEHHLKTIQNMAAVPGHVKAMPISQNHAYKKQSHAVKPSKIESFVGGKSSISSKLKTKKPTGNGDY
jgi:hypothetical protein